MRFTIRKSTTEEDLENFYQISFELAKKYRFSESELLELSDQQLFDKHRQELNQIDFDDPDRCLYVAHDENGVFAGAIWAAVREQPLSAWDSPDELPAWIYDVEVCPEFRGQGLGRQLLLQVEEWTREKGISHIGLHISFWLSTALHLYRSLDYKERSLILRKELTEVEADLLDEAFTIRKRKKGEELKEYFALRLGTFKDLVHVGPKVSKDEIQRKYPRFKARYDLDNPEYRAYVAEDKDSVFAGLVLGKTAEKTVWVLDIEVKPEFRRRGIGRRLLKQIEGWALKHRRSKISVYLNVHCKAAFRLFQLMNYKVTDYYMEKKIL